MKFLFTGGSGFLGKSVIPKLENEFDVISIGLNKTDKIQWDLSKRIPAFVNNYDVVLHAAGKAHRVPRSIVESLSFFNVNLDGTKNLCEALEPHPPKSFIFISTVAVYGIEVGNEIDENYPLNGNSPYALSKIEAETFLKNWCKKYNVKLSILRPSLIAGQNPPGNLGAMINGLKTGRYLRIGDGGARKSILMAEDIARLIPKLIQKGGTYNICDNHHPSFFELEELIASQLNKKGPKAIPIWLAKTMGSIGDLFGSKAPINTAKLEKITQSLTFSNEKAKRELNWEPLDVLKNFKIESRYANKF
ncbi:NAD-dependent epimerase/dehydratase family protein [Maribellus comscasis]|uniref:NAD-dependent epimerase/dehydratase family protein n=1 Tax=Maribellus comscasis TaxID=2681766 RepID=A0A6I6JU03_9BACT|nr:NAD(P)-dependent oxidoreductase [Maribellus comscasis]QGY46575.1 NAD-dependent epimerase/dehydratase family protein [Maribellus comscasis]